MMHVGHTVDCSPMVFSTFSGAAFEQNAANYEGLNIMIASFNK